METLSEEVAAKILQLFDDECSDTICAGPFNYRYDSLVCRFDLFQRCWLQVTLFSNDSDAIEEGHERTVMIRGIRGVNDMIEERHSDDGERSLLSLKSKFHDEVMRLLREVQATVRVQRTGVSR